MNFYVVYIRWLGSCWSILQLVAGLCTRLVEIMAGFSFFSSASLFLQVLSNVFAWDT